MLPRFCCCCIIGLVHSQQRLRLAIGNNNDNSNPPGGVDVVRRERYDYHAPGFDRQLQCRAGQFAGVIPGIILTAASSALHWWNEGRAFRDACMLLDARREVSSSRFESPAGHFNPHPRYRLGRDKMTVKDARLSNGLYFEPDLVDQIANEDFFLALSTDSKDNHHH